jgi:GTP1/Obg family GTP-binding protein
MLSKYPKAKKTINKICVISGLCLLTMTSFSTRVMAQIEAKSPNTSQIDPFYETLISTIEINDSSIMQDSIDYFEADGTILTKEIFINTLLSKILPRICSEQEKNGNGTIYSLRKKILDDLVESLKEVFKEFTQEPDSKIITITINTPNGYQEIREFSDILDLIKFIQDYKNLFKSMLYLRGTD